jgi:hypothetical protein
MPPSSAPGTANAPTLKLLRRLPGTRVLAWDGEALYISSGYRLLRSKPLESESWEIVGECSPVWWRRITSASRLGYRLMRDGFHALAVLRTGHVVAALPGAIATLAPGDAAFRMTHSVARGTRPLFIAPVPDGRVYWGEYFDNPKRDEVNIYGSCDCGVTWDVVHTFPRQSIRHVHNIVFDRWRECLWVLTGDNRDECRILRASLDWKHVDVVLAGNQQARAVAAVPAAEGLYFASDTPLEQNYIYRLNPDGRIEQLAEINSSVLCGCAVANARFFSTMTEPSEVNRDRRVILYGSQDGSAWPSLQSWEKDSWSLKLFQYGNAFLPSGVNTTNLLALTTIAVKGHDLETSLWQVSRE